MSARRPQERPFDEEAPRVDPLLEVRETHRGVRPGDRRVKIVRPFEAEFERGPGGQLVASEQTILTRTGWHSALRAMRTFLIGRPISSEHEQHERLTKVKALAVFSSDNISSSAYATEEIMRILILGSVAAISLTLPITAVIVIVLGIVGTSYAQTIKAYPHGASSYIVASDNLGTIFGLIAAAALLIDYVLTVAVSVSSGVAAITSIAPAVFPERVLIAVGIVLLLMLGNLRGIRESGTIFMAPTYLYIGGLLMVLGAGLFQFFIGHDLAVFQAPPDWRAHWESAAAGIGGLSLFLVLRAFSSGAAGLTGVEAVSDGVPAFKKPEWKNARATLVAQVIIFGSLFLGISFLASQTRVLPDPNEVQTVLSLITRQVVGSGWILFFMQVTTALILALAANTSFADFPRLSFFLARVRVLSCFQSGLVFRGWRRHQAARLRGLVIHGLGAATTAVIAVIIASTKFLSGAWLVIVMAPVLIMLMLGIRRHYRVVDAALALERIPEGKEVAAEPIVIVPVARLDRAARQAIAFANSISSNATAIHITNDPSEAADLRERWPDWAGTTELVVVESPYRALIGPLLRYMDALQAQDPKRPIVVVLSEFVPRHWWEQLLHNQTSLRLKLRLFGRRNTIVADVPYHLPKPEVT